MHPIPPALTLKIRLLVGIILITTQLLFPHPASTLPKKVRSASPNPCSCFHTIAHYQVKPLPLLILFPSDIITLYPLPPTITVIHSNTLLENFNPLWFIYSFSIQTSVITLTDLNIHVDDCMYFCSSMVLNLQSLVKFKKKY